MRPKVSGALDGASIEPGAPGRKTTGPGSACADAGALIGAWIVWRQAWKLWPQPQVPVAFGLSILKPEPSRLSM